MVKVATKTTGPRQLTLKDRLSRLTFRKACKLLGPDGARLIRHGGGYDVIPDDGVYLGNDLFRLSLPDAIVTITLMADAPDRLHWNCTACNGACPHVGAAFSLILEEKLSLGLAAPPPERTPVESLSEEELIRQAVEERRQRALTERMRIKSTNSKKLWSDYLVTNTASGKTYRVALRGWEPGQSYCSCPDFRKNTLGVCKHILNVQNKVRKRFSASAIKRPYRRDGFAVHLRYGKQAQLRLLCPEKMDKAAEAVVRPARKGPVTDIRDLLKRIRRLESLGHEVTVYPDTEEYINRRLIQEDMAAKMAEIRKNPKGHPLRRELLKVELLPYQLDGIAFAAGTGRAILADDMGLGKTIQGIGVAELLARQTDIKKVLVVCPASVKSQWRSEISRFSERHCQLVLGGAAERARQYDNGSFFTICNYEQVLRDILAIERARWDLIILDEGQRIKNWEAKTSRIIKSLRSPFALVLTGTPLENRLAELFSVVEFVDDRRLGPSFRFFNRHRTVDEKGKVLGYKNLDKLRENLKGVLLRRTRDSVMRQLPSRMTEVVRIAPTEEQYDMHGAHMRIVNQIVRKKYLTEMDLLRLQKALLMCRMAANSTFLVDKCKPGYSSKLERIDELLEELSQERGRKIVLFSEWTNMLNLIKPLLEKHRIIHERLDGSIPQKKRHRLIHEFQNNPRCKVLVSTNAGATGLNLQAANTVINVDLPWNPAVLEQRISRVHRMGQKRPVQVYVLVTERTIEEGLLGTLAAKHELAMAALDVSSKVDSVDLVGGMEELKRRLELLLGAMPEKPIDESERTRQAAEAERVARRERIASAGGRLLNAVACFVGELVGEQQMLEKQYNEDFLRENVRRCIQRDEQGRARLSIPLPDASDVDGLIDSLAGFLKSAMGNGGR